LYKPRGDRCDWVHSDRQDIRGQNMIPPTERQFPNVVKSAGKANLDLRAGRHECLNVYLLSAAALS
jgi:hypothetical protein